MISEASYKEEDCGSTWDHTLQVKLFYQYILVLPWWDMVNTHEAFHGQLSLLKWNHETTWSSPRKPAITIVFNLRNLLSPSWNIEKLFKKTDDHQPENYHVNQGVDGYETRRQHQGFNEEKTDAS